MLPLESSRDFVLSDQSGQLFTHAYRKEKTSNCQENSSSIIKEFLTTFITHFYIGMQSAQTRAMQGHFGVFLLGVCNWNLLQTGCCHAGTLTWCACCYLKWIYDQPWIHYSGWLKPISELTLEDALPLQLLRCWWNKVEPKGIWEAEELKTINTENYFLQISMCKLTSKTLKLNICCQ